STSPGTRRRPRRSAATTSVTRASRASSCPRRIRCWSACCASEGDTMDRNLAMDLVRVTEAAALAAARHMGRGAGVAAGTAAVEAMRQAFDGIAIDGTVVIGEGPEDAIPMLYVGERVGTAQGPQVDVALDGIEGATSCATGAYNAISVIAIADPGTL